MVDARPGRTLSRGASATDTVAGLQTALSRIGGQPPIADGTAVAVRTGAADIDAALPGRGLRLGALHEVSGAGAGGFTAALAGRIAGTRSGLVVWCQHRRRRRDEGVLHGPGLMAFGLDPDRLLLVDGDGDAAVLWALEEALRSPATAVAVGEVDRIDLFKSRRLQLAAETGGGAGLLLRPAAPLLEPSAAVTRWRVRSLARPGPRSGELASLAWNAELWRAKGAVPCRFEVSFDEQTLCFALAADLARGPLPAAGAAGG